MSNHITGMEKEDFLGGIIKTIFMTRSLIHQDRRSGKVSFLRIIVLRYVLENKEPTMKDIANYLDITMPSASSIINDLAKLDFIKRKNDPKDRRLIRLILTKKGEAIVKQELGRMVKVMRENLSSLSLVEQKKLFEIMQKVYKHLAAKNK